jgi:uncharacterized protein YndB with AHSA1/START domain
MGELREKVSTVRRVIAADRAFLFAAWTDPTLFAQWFGPASWTVERCVLDPRPEGPWRAWFRRTDGGGVEVGGKYLRFEPPFCLAFTWAPGPAGAIQAEHSEVTVEFTEIPAGVEIAITHRKLSVAEAADMDVGWNNTLDSLEAFVGRNRSSPKES